VNIKYKLIFAGVFLVAIIAYLIRRLMLQSRVNTLESQRYESLSQTIAAKDKIHTSEKSKIQAIEDKHYAVSQEISKKQTEITEAASEGPVAIADKWAKYLTGKQ